MLTPIPDAVTIDYTTWPQAADVVKQLIGGRYWPSNADEREGNFLAATIGIDSAVSELEERTGWHPFLADNSEDGLTETRYFDAPDPNGLLNLEGGLLDHASTTVHGAALISNTNLFLRPSNAQRNKEPYTELHLPYSGLGGMVWNVPNGIAVTGRWGRFRTLPPDVYFAVLRYAVYLTLTSGNQDQDIGGWSKNGFSEQFDLVGPLDPKTVTPLLRKEFDATISRYMRVVV